MKAKINLISIITSNFEDMLTFYKDSMGFEVINEVDGHFAEFNNEWVRFAISTHEVMADATGHSSFTQARNGQSFELAFSVASPWLVDSTYQDLIANGATHIQHPDNMPRWQRAAFFADPDGNIHEIFAEITP